MYIESTVDITVVTYGGDSSYVTFTYCPGQRSYSYPHIDLERP
jgi:hypothetical protein